MASVLHKLGDLEKDLHDVKVSFRNDIVGHDTESGGSLQRNAKDSIYVLCDHLFKLFATLSNVRMCHEIYGLKSPHSKWEGILALDIWYNFLYKGIDAQYLNLFNEKYINANPMSRFKVREYGEIICEKPNEDLIDTPICPEKIVPGPEDTSEVVCQVGFEQGQIVCTKPPETEDGGVVICSNEVPPESKVICKFPMEANTKVIYYYGQMFVLLGYYGKQERGIAVTLNGDRELVWMVDKDFPNHVLVWDESLFKELDGNAKAISLNRRDCTSPRGVLGKIWNIVSGFASYDEICDRTSGDFAWFKQSGKVYSDSSKSTYTKYINLHLGSAYDAMTPREYCQLMDIPPEIGEDGNKVFMKPSALFMDDDEHGRVKEKMVRRGCLALQDAFSVMRHKHSFNICNSTTGQVEEFNPEHLEEYSDSQAALVIERLFSELYDYLHFKTTSDDVIQSHVNFDNGYKYLTDESLSQSENPITHLYCDRGSRTPYLPYVSRLLKYIADSRDSSSELHGVLDDQDEV